MSQPGNGGPEAAETLPVKHRIGAGEHDRITAHYRLAVPLMTALFGGTPLVYAAYPSGLDHPRVWHGPLRSRPPVGVPTRDVPSTHGVQAYLTLSDSAMDWVTAHRSAVEFYGWGCTADDPARARFALIELELDANYGDALLRAAMILRDVLQKCELRAIPVLRGAHSLALWVPLAGGPLYSAVRAWLYALCAQAAAERPTMFSLEPNAHVAGRVHLHVGSNAPGRHSALPYSLSGGDQLRTCTPIAWDELSNFGNGAIAAQQFPARLAAVGEVFGAQLAQIGDRSLPKPAPPSVVTAEVTDIHRSGAVDPADRMVPVATTDDAWPEVEIPQPPPIDPSTRALIERLGTTAGGSDRTAFAIAVCDAFAHLGFVATHVGGDRRPDGYVDSPLGACGYRAIFACTTGDRVALESEPAAVGRYTGDYRAQAGAVVGRVFGERAELADELQDHNVSAWSVADLQQLLRIRSNPHEMRALFASGFVADRIGDLLWARIHGAAKRVTLICRYLREAGWAAQIAFATTNREGSVARAPRLSIDAAMLLVDQRLAEEGSRAVCTRSDVRGAFAYLTSPRVAAAVWIDAETEDAIAILRPADETPDCSHRHTAGMSDDADARSKAQPWPNSALP